jgi:hypothetical protein
MKKKEKNEQLAGDFRGVMMIESQTVNQKHCAWRPWSSLKKEWGRKGRNCERKWQCVGSQRRRCEQFVADKCLPVLEQPPPPPFTGFSAKWKSDVKGTRLQPIDECNWKRWICTWGKANYIQVFRARWTTKIFFYFFLVEIKCDRRL